jgi:hypothetical protein
MEVIFQVSRAVFMRGEVLSLIPDKSSRESVRFHRRTSIPLSGIDGVGPNLCP